VRVSGGRVIEQPLALAKICAQSGDLALDRARASALVFRLARQERNAWFGWPARVAALMAGDLGVGTHAMQTVLEKHVREHLVSFSEIRPDFR
jgi:hypothetical protein